MKISVIIPVLNEAGNLPRLLCFLDQGLHKAHLEIVVIDGGSTDNSIEVAQRFGVHVERSPIASRAVQMNLGARVATGDTLYFLHADTLPPHTFYMDIKAAVSAGHPMGCFRLKLGSPGSFLGINSYFSRFPSKFSGGGDQSLYISKKDFWGEGGFDESYTIMEDFEFVHRARTKLGLYIIPKDVLASARKYQQNSFIRVTLANLIAFMMFSHGQPPEKIKKFYEFALRPNQLLDSVKGYQKGLQNV